jgi:hypothetical protein
VALAGSGDALRVEALAIDADEPRGERKIAGPLA